jgi:hypothetical protein
VDVAKPYEWGVFASAWERAMDQVAGNPHAWEGFADWPWAGSSLRNALLPWKEEMIAGSVKPFIEAMTNYSWFTGRNIVPAYEERLELDRRKGTGAASQIGQAVQRAIGVDARKIDYVVQSVFGGFGRIATARSDDPGWWAGATTGMVSRSPSWESEDMQWALDYAEKRGLSGGGDWSFLRDKLKTASQAKTQAEHDRLAESARKYASWLRRQYDR